MSDGERTRPDCPDGENESPEHKSVKKPQGSREEADRGKKLLQDKMPEMPEEFTELQTLKILHPSLFLEQAQLLKARFDALMKAGFNAEQAMQIILRWGLKKNLTDS